MELKTAVKVNYSKSNRINAIGNDYVHGITTDVKFDLINDMVEVLYEYFIPESEGQGREVIRSSVKVWTFDQIQAVKDSLTVEMPANLSEKEELQWKYREGMRLLMAQTFNLPLSKVVNV